MMSTKKPALIGGSGGLDTTQQYVLSGDQYNAFKAQIAELKARIEELEIDNNLKESELNATIWALTQCHQDMPVEWSRFIVGKVYPAQIPENVRIRLRHGLKPAAGGFMRAVT